MDQFVAWLEPIVERFGGVGMFILAAVDCSFISMPNASDVLIIWQTIEHPDRWAYYAFMTTLGSVVGSMVIYEFGRRGGEAFLSRRFKPEKVARVRAVFSRYGMWAIVVVAMLPPPAPYKVFLLLAGVGGLGPGVFALSVAIGRGLRYGVEAWLARAYGDAAAQLVKDNMAAFFWWVLAGCVVAGAMVLVWRQRSGRRRAA